MGAKLDERMQVFQSRIRTRTIIQRFQRFGTVTARLPETFDLPKESLWAGRLPFFCETASS